MASELQRDIPADQRKTARIPPEPGTTHVLLFVMIKRFFDWPTQDAHFITLFHYYNKIPFRLNEVGSGRGKYFTFTALEPCTMASSQVFSRLTFLTI